VGVENNIRFYLDENVANDIAEGLRHRGIDVVTTPEAGNMGLTDEEHLAFALAQNRVIVTQDSDFLILDSQGLPHAGIVYYKPQTRTVKDIISGLLLIYGVLSPEEMHNHIEFL
jgi:uncharacterized protein with PIN domain